MFVVFCAKSDSSPVWEAQNTVASIEEAFHRICDAEGLSYRYSPDDWGGWWLEFDCLEAGYPPSSIHSACERLQDAQAELLAQAIDGRIGGHLAVSDDSYAFNTMLCAARSNPHQRITFQQNSMSA